MQSRILMYHGLDSPSAPAATDDPGELVYVLDLDRFIAQLDWAADNRWNITLPGAETTDSKRAIITFDDGHISNHTLAFPALQARSLSAVFFITTDWIGDSNYMTADMIRELSDAGMVIGSHGVSHQFLTDLDSGSARSELLDSKRRLEAIVGHPVTTISAPGGRVDERIAALAREAGYTDVFTSDTEPRLRCQGLRIHGRMTLRRNYTLQQFTKMMDTGDQPESVLRTKGLRVAKRLLGNRRYEQLRSSALRVLSKRKR